MVIMLTGMHQNFCDPRVLFLVIVVSDRPAHRRCLNELGSGSDNCYYFHLVTVLKLGMGVVAAGLGSGIEKNLPELVLYHLLVPIRVLDS